MKKISKKEWGILGTSAGSMLIIVALLVIVGIGSGITYSAAVIPDDSAGGGTTSSSSSSSKSSSSSSSKSSSSSSSKSSSSSSSSVTKVTCSAGQYHVGQGHCGTCPAGSYCPGGTFNYGDRNVGINACPSGTTSPAGSASSAACKSSSDTTTCPAGQYYSGQGNCATCLAGYYCPGGTFSSSDSSRAGINACPSGTTSLAGSSSSTACKESSSGSSSSSDATKVTCPAGQYHVGQGHFATCPAGYYCPGGTFNYGDRNVGMTKCPDGTTSNAGASSLSACKSTSSTTTCPAGQYYYGQGSCATCLAGYYCPGGTFSSSDSSRAGITQCPSGTTSAAGSSSQTSCKSVGATTTCPAGQYYAGQGSCATCLSGYYCPGGIFSSGDSSRDGIYSCPANATCTSSSFTCNSGYVKNSAGTACVASGGGNTGGSGSGSGGNGGGNTGGNGSGGNTPTPSNSSSNNGGNNGGNGNNSGSSNVNQNPGTLTKTPLVIALIGMISVGLGTFTYFKGKKEQNNEI